MKGLSSLTNSIDKSLQALPPDARADYHFNVWKENNLKHQAGLLTDDELSNLIERNLYDAIAGLGSADVRECLHGVSDRLFLMLLGFYLKERINHLDAVKEVIRASKIIFYDPDAPPEEYFERVDECKRREASLQKVIDEILSQEVWSLIEAKAGVTKPEVFTDAEH